MGRRRISATARRPALAATHQRATQARQRRTSGTAAAAAPGAAVAPSRRGGGGRLACGAAGVGAPPQP